MKNFYFYQMDINPKKTNFMVCFYSGRNFCIETFYNEIVNQFDNSFFIRDIVFITPEFNEQEITERLLCSESQSTMKDRINSLQELDFHTCFIKRNGEFKLDIFNEMKICLTPDEMSNIINFGLYNIIKHRDLIVKAHSNIHFIKPSGKHSNKFIDVKNLLESAAEITFIATCLLKLLPEKISKIYVDTSGIYSLAYELSNIIRAFERSHEIIAIDSFGSYEGIAEYNFTSDKDTLILISASTRSA